MFNTLKYVRQLEGVGLTREQAETHIQIMTEIVNTDFATKQNLIDFKNDMTLVMTEFKNEMHQDMGDFKTEMRRDMNDFKKDIRQDMTDLRNELRQDMKALEINTDHKLSQLELRLTMKLGTITSLAVGVAVALSKLVA